MMAGEYTNQGLIWPLFATGIYFLVFVGILTLLFARIEKKLDFFKA
jgi:polar amino acid transport system permease protein